MGTELKKIELRDPKAAGVLRVRTWGLEFHHVLGLGAFGALNHLKLHFLIFGQGAEAFSLNGAVMYKDIRTVIPGNKAISLGIVEPFYSACFLH